MKLKNKYIVTMAMSGVIILSLGSLFKITHHPAAGALLFAGYFVMITASILFLIQAFTIKDKNHFLNK